MRTNKKLLSVAVAAVVAGTAVPTSSVLAGKHYGQMPMGTLVFDGIDYADTDAEKRQILAAEAVTVDGQDYPIGYKTLMRSGDQPGQGIELPEEWRGTRFGGLVDVNGDPVLQVDGSQRVSQSNDFSSLLDLGDKGLWMVSHFEDRPAAMYLSQLSQDEETGELSAVKTRPIDFSQVRGGWVHCAGSVTPWTTHLGSEEYEPDARMFGTDPLTGTTFPEGIKYTYDRDDNAIEDTYYSAMFDYVGGDATALNPYDYGWTVEVQVKNDKGDTDVVKHYAMGRTALELAYVMPDEMTAYLTDDGTNVGLFMFVADRKGDLSAGALYAAKWVQKTCGPEVNAPAAGCADLEWIPLGHATNDQIEQYLVAPGKLTFGDIFDAKIPYADDSCDAGYTLVAKGHAATTGDTYKECLKLKPGMEIAASRLETRRYAAMLGATTEWRKMEGITFDPDGKKLYLAMSEVEYGMEDMGAQPAYNIAAADHIDVEPNDCGAVYAMDVGKYQGIGSKYVAKNMYGEVEGILDGVSPNKCNLDGIANPDNLTFITGYNTLIIGEDTGSGHQNDVIWGYDLASKGLTRILSTPYGSETTSPYWYPNINGFGYLMAVTQHPYGESDSDKYEIGSMADRGYTGYVGPFPAMGNGKPGHHDYDEDRRGKDRDDD
ncbi:MAG: alkaline phosphatase PhoX [Chromatiaceae bacterium]